MLTSILIVCLTLGLSSQTEINTFGLSKPYRKYDEEKKIRNETIRVMLNQTFFDDL